MFRLSPVIVASVQRARNPQAEIERLALGRRKAAPRRLAMVPGRLFNQIGRQLVAAQPNVRKQVIVQFAQLPNRNLSAPFRCVLTHDLRDELEQGISPKTTVPIL